ncbi:RND transporter, HAE1/HME family, permease protein [Hyella patelloides LEGE 07179]|uniref:RND transporter, HAE1/HME family, permease protein n=1 Tax=Hyella patelloides LEGE 07179 TaxID=945734 RepID=A0A563VS70_9CYAN|nr:efflux RND transporter permease subunit [Hyella patelloides]VEP14298.1 RND transporter, HAE1/HME family, permease protein [Hyella patelloides LEGE 07179]
MSFSLSTWSIKNPIPIIVLFTILAILGLASFSNLEIDTYPNIDIPSISITIVQQGASPTELESQVSRKVEDAVAELDKVDRIISKVRDEVSLTSVAFKIGIDNNDAVNDVRNAVAQIRQDLPQDIEEPIVEKDIFYREPVITYAVTSTERSIVELSEFVDRQLLRKLLTVPGVAEADRLGGVDREIRINLDSNRLQAYGITAAEVNDQIIQFNVNLPGGRLNVGENEQNVRILGSAETVSNLRNYPIELSTGDTVDLSSLGIVEDSFADVRNSAYLGGTPAVAFSIERGTGSSIVTVEENVRQAVAELEPELPKDINLELVFTRADTIRASSRSTLEALILGSLLTIVVVGISLRDWRITLITTIALPLSIIPTFWVMKTLDYTLNTMTLSALALAVGNLVDDAICMIENIDQHLHQGKKPFKAAIDAAEEIGLAVIATTATIVAVFVPVAFMGGVPGQFFQPFGVTFAVSTVFSTLIACTVTPMLSAYWLKPTQKTLNVSIRNINKRIGQRRLNSPIGRLKPGIYIEHRKAINQPTKENSPAFQFAPYRHLLNWSLSHRNWTVVIAVIIFIASLSLSAYIPQGLSDGGDLGLSTIAVELPPGSTLQETENVLHQLGKSIKENSAVKNVLEVAGHDGQVHLGLAYVSLKDKADRDLSQRQFEQQLRPILNKIPGAKISFRSSGVGVGNKDLSLVLRGKDPDILTKVAKNAEAQMKEIPGLVDISSSVNLVKPEIAIIPDPVRAKSQGVSVSAISRTAFIATIGNINSSLAKFNLADRQIPIRVQLDSSAQKDINTIRNLQVPSNQGSLVSLKSVAHIRLASGPEEINRLDRSRQVILEANLQNIALGNALQEIRSIPALNPLPDGVTEEPVPGGDAEIMRDVFQRFSTALILGIICIYGILILLYNNFLYPLAILTALPLSVGGAFVALLITQKELGLFALIGMVLLMGLVTKNAILLVDFCLDGVRNGVPLIKSVIDAGASRLRPILMTSVSTIAGMIPIALGLGADGEVRSPMAIAVIGGFTTSTLLTLVVVPILFIFIYNWNKHLRNMASSQKQEPT